MCRIKFQESFRNVGVSDLSKKSYSRKNAYLRKPTTLRSDLMRSRSKSARHSRTIQIN